MYPYILICKGVYRYHAYTNTDACTYTDAYIYLHKNTHTQIPTLI